jgi:5-methyltetrahydropteroyltriglutamate--homocysteine methyltransferase
LLRSTDRILTSHVGSLLRPVEVMRFINAKDAQEPHDKEKFAAVLDTTIGEVVREQARVGIDIVNDGEFSRTSYANYVRDRLSGYEMKKPGDNIVGTLDQVRFGNLVPGMIRDRERFGYFVQMWRRVERTMFMPEELYSSASRTTPTEVPVCTGPFRYTAMDELTEDLNRLKALLSRVDVKGEPL